MLKIADISSREILDSRGDPTLETTIFLSNGIFASASVPSGASTGAYEAIELRDKDNSRFNGKGVLKAISNIEKIIRPKLIGMEIGNQEKVDLLMQKLDGTKNKKKLGGNTILSVSLAYARASAKAIQIPLYSYIKKLSRTKTLARVVSPMFNIINGGLHGGNNNLSIQEFLLIINESASFMEKLQKGVQIYQALKQNIKRKKMSTSIGDEGGFSPFLSANKEALDLILETIKECGFSCNSGVSVGLDMAASTYFKDNKYINLNTPSFFIDKQNYYSQVKLFCSRYKLISVEDPFFYDYWQSWIKFSRENKNKIMIIGDDLLVTNIERLKKAIRQNACNAILIKPNQIGTLTETLAVIYLAKKAKFKIIISHRSGETNDDFIADLAVGVNADYVKFGAPTRGERVAKYNRLLKIYSNLNISV